MDGTLSSSITPDESEEFDDVVESSPEGSRFVRFKDILRKDKFKEVYRAVDTDRGIEVAWNKIPLDRFEFDEQEILKEIEVLKGIQHQNIIEISDYWVDHSKEQVVFITELLASGTLLKYIEKSPRVRLRVIKRWCKQILQGLEYLHSRHSPIIHGDIKCDNIFINGVSEEGEVKIGDIGLVTFSLRKDLLSVIGTPHFMAPEYYGEEAYSTEVDIWAFGMAIIEMITRKRPYFECGTNVGMIVEKVCNFTLPVQFAAVSDDEVKNFISLCFEKKGNRPTATELLNHPFFSHESENDNVPVSIDEAMMNQLSAIELPEDPPTESSSQSITPNVLSSNLITPTRSKSVSKISHPPKHVDNSDSGTNNKSNYNIQVDMINTVNANPNAISLKLQIDTANEQMNIDFEYNLQTDSPTVVATEMCEEMGFDSSVGDDIRDLIEQQVQMFQNQSEEAYTPPVLRKSIDIEELPKPNSPPRIDYDNHGTSEDTTVTHTSPININGHKAEIPITPSSSGNFPNAEDFADSPQFTCPPPTTKDDPSYIEEMESLLDSSDDAGETNQDLLFTFDEDTKSTSALHSVSDNTLTLSTEVELEKIRRKHAEAKERLLAQQKKELEELAERRKRQKRGANYKSDDEPSAKKKLSPKANRQANNNLNRPV